mmetsp:Transcript_30391/g.65204  ORF Transcript_30391/g.65204 Transcript_30391/m.65204 type:complete len:325 (+) Transcript_30391:43-1017(+)
MFLTHHARTADRRLSLMFVSAAASPATAAHDGPLQHVVLFLQAVSLGLQRQDLRTTALDFLYQNLLGGLPVALVLPDLFSLILEHVAQHRDLLGARHPEVVEAGLRPRLFHGQVLRLLLQFLDAAVQKGNHLLVGSDLLGDLDLVLPRPLELDLDVPDLSDEELFHGFGAVQLGRVDLLFIPEQVDFLLELRQLVRHGYNGGQFCVGKLRRHRLGHLCVQRLGMLLAGTGGQRLCFGFCGLQHGKQPLSHASRCCCCCCRFLLPVYCFCSRFSGCGVGEHRRFRFRSQLLQQHPQRPSKPRERFRQKPKIQPRCTKLERKRMSS